MFITVFTTANRLPLSSASFIQSSTAHHISLRSISYPPIHTYILQVISFLKCSPPPIALYAFLLTSNRGTCPTISSSPIDQSEVFEWKFKSWKLSWIQISSSTSCFQALTSCVLPLMWNTKCETQQCHTTQNSGSTWRRNITYEGWNFNFGNAALTFNTAHLQSSYVHRPSMYSPKLCGTRSRRWGSRMMPFAAPVLLMVRTERSTAEGLNPPCNCPIR